MKLKELAPSYRDSAQRIAPRICQLKQELACTRDPNERSRLEGRISELMAMMRECRDLAIHCERYYERGYRRNVKYTV